MESVDCIELDLLNVRSPNSVPRQTFQTRVHSNPSISLYTRMSTKQTSFHGFFTALLLNLFA
jgi:hypothetical protein